MDSRNKPEPELVLETWGNAGKQRYSSFAHLNLPTHSSIHCSFEKYIVNTYFVLILGSRS